MRCNQAVLQVQKGSQDFLKGMFSWNPAGSLSLGSWELLFCPEGAQGPGHLVPRRDVAEREKLEATALGSVPCGL